MHLKMLSAKCCQFHSLCCACLKCWKWTSQWTCLTERTGCSWSNVFLIYTMRPSTLILRIPAVADEQSPSTIQLYRWVYRTLQYMQNMLRFLSCLILFWLYKLFLYIDGLVQERLNSSALAVVFCLSRTNPSSCWFVLTLKRLGHFFFQNVILFSNVVQY